MPNNVISKIQLPNGNTYDIKDSEAKRKQTTVSDPTASGTAVEFIDSISQDVEGVITPTKKIVATVTTSTDGLMSSTDKTKLDGIEANAQVNSVTGVKGAAENSYRTGNINLTPENLGIPSSNATQSTDGFMSSTDKSKLDGIEVGAEVNTITGIKGNEENTYRTGNINLTSANIGAKAVQTAVTDPVAEGTSIEFIDSISQNAQGVITPTKKTVATVTTSTNGLMSASDKNKLDNLDAEDVGAIKDDYNYNYVSYPYTGNELILLHNTTTGENTVTDVASFLSSAGGSGSGSNQGALVHYTKKISLNATVGTQAQSFSDNNITENMVVLRAEIENPSAQVNDWIFNTVNGMVTLNGTVNAATNVTLYFGVSLSAAPSIKVNLSSNEPDNILKANPTPGVMGTLGRGYGGTGVNATDAADLRSKLGITPANIGAVSTADVIDIPYGGTGATTPEGARTNLGITLNDCDGYQIVQLNNYTDQSNSFVLPYDGYIRINGGNTDSGYVRVVIRSPSGNVQPYMYMNVTGVYQIQSMFVKKGMRVYVLENTAQSSTITYFPLTK